MPRNSGPRKRYRFCHPSGMVSRGCHSGGLRFAPTSGKVLASLREGLASGIRHPGPLHLDRYHVLSEPLHLDRNLPSPWLPGGRWSQQWNATFGQVPCAPRPLTAPTTDYRLPTCPLSPVSCLLAAPFGQVPRASPVPRLVRLPTSDLRPPTLSCLLSTVPCLLSPAP